MKQIPIKICNVYAVDFPSMVFRRLGKEGKMVFSKRSIYGLYPSSIKSTYALNGSMINRYTTRKLHVFISPPPDPLFIDIHNS